MSLLILSLSAVAVFNLVVQAVSFSVSAGISEVASSDFGVSVGAVAPVAPQDAAASMAALHASSFGVSFETALAILLIRSTMRRHIPLALSLSFPPVRHCTLIALFTWSNSFM